MATGIEPITREEQILSYIAGEGGTLPEPVTRVERLLYYIALNGGGGCGGGTGDGYTKAQMDLILKSYAKTTDLPKKISALTNDANYQTDAEVLAAITQELADYAKSADIPKNLSDLTSDANHRTVTDAEKEAWNGKQDALELSKKAANILSKETDGLYAPAADLTGYVQKKTGYELAKSTDLVQIIQNKNAIETLNGDSTVAGSVDKKISLAISSLQHLEKEIVAAVPSTSTAKDNVIYLVPGKPGTYNQYLKIGEAVVGIGSTDIDMSEYVKKDGDKVLSSNDFTNEDKAKLESIDTENFVDVNQGIASKDKPLVVGEDGKVKAADLPGYVKTETGKSLVSDEDIKQISTNKKSIETLNADEDTEGSVAKQIKDAIAATTHLTKEVIDHVPTVSEAKPEVLYLVPTDTEGIYAQYTLVSGKIIALDNTKIDLSGYFKTEDIVTAFSENASDEKVPSEKLVKDSLVEKSDKYSGEINVNKDIDTITETGTWKINSYGDGTITHIPYEWGVLHVTNANSYIVQRFVTATNKEYIRFKDHTADWSDWVELVTTSNSVTQKEQCELKMLGWNVPKECPIQNEISGNQFIQKVGRFELSLLYWNGEAPKFNGGGDVLINAKLGSYDTPSKMYAYGYNIIAKWEADSGVNGIAMSDWNKSIYLTDDTKATIGELKTSLRGKFLYFELETPIITPIEGNEVSIGVKYYNSAATKNMDCDTIADPICLVTAASLDDFAERHFPFKDLMYIRTNRNIDDGLQEATSYHGDRRAYRTMVNNVWQPWKEIATMDKIGYSTEEKVIGTFIDGKTIYRKTFVFDVDGTTRYVHGIDMDSVFSCSGTMHDTEKGYWFALNIIDENVYTYISMEIGNRAFYYGGERTYGHTGTVYVTVEYTKA